MVEEISKSTLTKWKTTDLRFVAFLDLLGFKDKVMRKTHQEIYEELGKISKLKELVEKNTMLKQKKRFLDADVYVVSFSDSIVLFSKNNSFENFEYFLIALRAIFSNSIRARIALKGGMAYGEISLNKTAQVYFGQPIIDAYLIEEDVNYLGVVAHDSIDKFLNTYKQQTEDSPIVNKLIFKDKSYLKSGKITHFNLDWFILTQRDYEELEPQIIIDNIINDLDRFYFDVSGSPRRYIDNTKEILLNSHKENRINLKKLNVKEFE